MQQRCLNPNNARYSSYGGRGILIHQAWKIDFLNFLVDMGLCPSKDSSLERIDVNGNYEPSNCKWIPLGQQNLNKQKVVYYDDIKREVERIINESKNSEAAVSCIREYLNSN